MKVALWPNASLEQEVPRHQVTRRRPERPERERLAAEIGKRLYRRVRRHELAGELPILFALHESDYGAAARLHRPHIGEPAKIGEIDPPLNERLYDGCVVLGGNELHGHAGALLEVAAERANLRCSSSVLRPG